MSGFSYLAIYSKVRRTYLDFEKSPRHRQAIKLLSFTIQNLSVKGIKTCVFRYVKHACFDRRNTHVLGQYPS